MQGWTPPDSDPILSGPAPAGGIGRPVIRRAPEQPKPPSPNLPEGYQLGPDGVAFYTPGLPPPKAAGPAALTAEDRGKFTRQRQGALGLNKRISEIEQIYADAFRGAGGDKVNPATGERAATAPGLGSIKEYLPGRTPIIGRPVNEVFKNASGALMGDLAAAYGLTAQQQNTPVELEIRFGPFIPKAGDPDEVIEKKIARLKEIAAEQERQALDALGEAPAEKNEATPAPGLATTPAADGGNAPPGLGFTPSGNVIHQDMSPGATQGLDTGFVGEDGGTHSEISPKLAGANAYINSVLKKGAPDAAIVSYLQGRGAEPGAIREILAQARDIRAWRKKNPDYKGDFNIDVERVDVPNSALQNLANSDLGVGSSATLDAATGFNMDSVVGATGGDAEEVRRAVAAAQSAHPKSATAGTVAGGVGSALALEGLAAKAGLKGIPRTVAADVAFGGAAGAGATDYADDGSPASAGDRLVGAGKGAVAATAGGLTGQAVAGVGRGVARGAKDPYVAAINAEGVPTTVGQQYTGKLGGIVKRTEDRIAGLPIIGDIINARRVEGITKWNEKVFDRTLEPIGVKIEGRVGEAGVDYAQDKISDAFNKALKGKAVVADKALAKELTDAVVAAKSLPRVGDEVAHQVKSILEPYMSGGSISGEAMQQISRELRDLKAGYFRAGDPMKKPIGDAIDKVEDAIFGPFRRQVPDVLPEYNKAKAAQRRLYIVADAVNAAKNKEGIFMPSQLGSADKRATIKTEGKVNAARGRGQFHDMQRAAQEVLPGKIPDSGTAGRIIIPGIALGVGGGSDASGMTNGAGTTLAGVLALAYTRAGQRLLTKPGRGMGGRAGKVLQSDKTKKLLTAGGATVGTGLATQQ